MPANSNIGTELCRTQDGSQIPVGRVQFRSQRGGVVGECLIPIPVKLKAETVARIDGMREQLPLDPGRSTVARGLIEEVFLLIAEGILQFRSARGNRLLSVSSVSSVSGIPGIPSEFPASIAAPTAGVAKPPVRIRRGSDRGRESSYVSRMDVANRAWFTSFHIHSTPLNERVA